MGPITRQVCLVLFAYVVIEVTITAGVALYFYIHVNSEIHATQATAIALQQIIINSSAIEID